VVPLILIQSQIILIMKFAVRDRLLMIVEISFESGFAELVSKLPRIGIGYHCVV